MSLEHGPSKQKRRFRRDAASKYLKRRGGWIMLPAPSPRWPASAAVRRCNTPGVSPFIRRTIWTLGPPLRSARVSTAHPNVSSLLSSFQRNGSAEVRSQTKPESFFMKYFHTPPSGQRKAAVCNGASHSTSDLTPSEAFAIRVIMRRARVSQAQAVLIAELLGHSPEAYHG